MIGPLPFAGGHAFAGVGGTDQDASGLATPETTLRSDIYLAALRSIMCITKKKLA